MSVSATSNPFSTRWVRPGAIPYFFPPKVDARQVVLQLERQRWWGQIIGRHGSGKSTLLRSLIPAIEHMGRRVELFTLNNQQRRFPFTQSNRSQWDAKSLIVVDGFEQLNWWNRTKLKARCWQSQAGLLVTAHQCVRLPTLLTTDVSLQMAMSIVSRLSNESEVSISDDDVAVSYHRCAGNMRDVLFELYDLYERRKCPESQSLERSKTTQSTQS